MNQKIKILLLFAIGILVLLVIAYPFRRQIFIAYHKNRWFAAEENFAILTGQRARPTYFQQLKFDLLRMNDAAESNAAQHHGDALIAPGYWHKQFFEFTNRFLMELIRCISTIVCGIHLTSRHLGYAHLLRQTKLKFQLHLKTCRNGKSWLPTLTVSWNLEIC